MGFDFLTKTELIGKHSSNPHDLITSEKLRPVSCNFPWSVYCSTVLVAVCVSQGQSAKRTADPSGSAKKKAVNSTDLSSVFDSGSPFMISNAHSHIPRSAALIA